MPETATITPEIAAPEDVESARRLLVALVEGDAETFGALAHDLIELRDLNPHGLMTLSGREEALSALAMFTENVGRASLRAADARAVGHRIQVTYSYGSVKHGVRSHFEVHAFCEVLDGRVIVVDEVCSGRIPEAAS